MPNNFNPDKQKQINVVFEKTDHKKIVEKQKAYGFKTLAEYIRFVSLNADITVKTNATTCIVEKDGEKYCTACGADIKLEGEFDYCPYCSREVELFIR